MATREQGIRRTGSVTAGLVAVAAAGAIGFGVLAREHSVAAGTSADTATTTATPTTGTTATGTTATGGVASGSASSDSGSTSATGSTSDDGGSGTTLRSATGSAHASTGGS